MKILLVAPFAYAGASGQGGATVCANALAELVKHHDVAVLCFGDGSAADKLAGLEMRKQVQLFKSIPLHVGKLKAVLAKLSSTVSSTPEFAYYFRSRDFSSALAQMVSEFAPAVVVCQFPQMAQYLPELQGQVCVQDVQDAYSVSWYRRAAAAPSGLARWYVTRQWRNWLAYEARYYTAARQCWTLSEADRFGLKVFLPRLNVVTIGLALNGVLSNTRNDAAAKPKVGFVASFSHAPNVEALAFLLDEIVPRLTERHPDLEFTIAGRQPPASAVRGAASQVNFLGFVESMAEFYSQCSVIVAPLISGGGVKVKVAEALSHGKAVVTTSVGAEGMPLEDGVNAIIADSAEAFADGVSRLLVDAGFRKRIEAAALNCARLTFDRSNWSARVNQLLNRLVDGTMNLAVDAERPSRRSTASV